MNYEDFKQAFIAELMLRVDGSGIEIRENTVNKVNETREGLSLLPMGSNIATQIYIEDYYRGFGQGKTISSLAEEAVRFMEYSRGNVPQIPEVSHAFMEENLYLAVMNPELNREYLSDVPCEYLEDMAVVPRLKINEEASFVVKDWMLGEYGFSREELFKTARANMDRQEYRCMSLSGLVAGFVGSDPEPGPSDNIYVLTNMTSIDGAAAILSEKAMKEALEKVGEDFFILPSSRHEVILVPRSSNLTVAEMTDMVVSANRTVVEDKDLLSDHVYRYNSKSGNIKMLEPKAETPKIEQQVQPYL